MNNQKYIEGNNVGIVEGLEMAALYHDKIANDLSKGAIYDTNGSPINGNAIAATKHREHASNIRALKSK